ncbi:SWIM zinc finger family protein [Corynebacterium anserum]|uniref:Uncharacterized protein n=1 Tax=Corynebacterium anserum TaxID=2684406 RepID=A0A7G7YP75_9CORY|nr:SWIM zinc finger family protein [Corynebacterium anserum]MBC2681900.1 hypothetical protein [Corynebacterium anserum]QNH96295.1 hypothetical protein GP473_06125 [Corynebacterium anserum]
MTSNNNGSHGGGGGRRRGLPTRWGENVVMADFGARRRKEAAEAANSLPSIPRGESESWASAQLMEALAENTDSGRLARGREYYRGGKVLGVELAENIITGLVDGTQLEPFDVTFRLKNLPERKRAFLQQELLMDQSHLRSLMHRRAPGQEVSTILMRPDHLRQVSCTCPDRAAVCKHAVAVGYAVAAQLTRDPQQIFRLRGIDPEPFMAQLRKADEKTGAAALENWRGTHSGRDVASNKKAASSKYGVGKNTGGEEAAAEIVDPIRFWGSPDQRVTWGEFAQELGLDQGDGQALMAALRTVSWTGVDQLRAHHELERCYENLVNIEKIFDKLPWEKDYLSRPTDKNEDYD